MKTIRFLIATVISSFFNPVVIISLFGPLIQYVNIILLRYRLSLQLEEPLSELYELIDNIWVQALLSFNTQLFVLLLAWVFIFVEFARVVSPLIRKYNLEEIRVLVNGSTISYVMGLAILLFLFAGIFSFLNGTFASPNSIPLYLPKDKALIGRLTLPPFNSSVTIARGLIILQGVFFSYWERRILPELVKKMQKDNGEKI